MQVETPSPRVNPEDVGWALARLRPPTRHDLRLAHRVGVDPNTLLEAFNERYLAACVADHAAIDGLAGSCEDPDYDAQLWWALHDHITAIVDEHRQEWFEEPQLAVAEILQPTITDSEHEQLATMLRSSMTVGWSVTVNHSRGAAQTVSVGRVRATPRAARPRVRRTSASSTTSGADPCGSDSEPHSAGPPPLRLWRHPKYGATSPNLLRVLLDAERASS